MGLFKDSAKREYRAKSILIWGGDTEDVVKENVVGYTLQSIEYGDAINRELDANEDGKIMKEEAAERVRERREEFGRKEK